MYIYIYIYIYIFIHGKLRNDKTYGTSEEELNVVIKIVLKNWQSQCETLNLLENTANQDKMLEEKLNKKKRNHQVKKEILLYRDFDVTKDIENVNKK